MVYCYSAAKCDILAFSELYKDQIHINYHTHVKLFLLDQKSLVSIFIVWLLSVFTRPWSADSFTHASCTRLIEGIQNSDRLYIEQLLQYTTDWLQFFTSFFAPEHKHLILEYKTDIVLSSWLYFHPTLTEKTF